LKKKFEGCLKERLQLLVEVEVERRRGKKGMYLKVLFVFDDVSESYFGGGNLMRWKLVFQGKQNRFLENHLPNRGDITKVLPNQKGLLWLRCNNFLVIPVLSFSEKLLRFDYEQPQTAWI